MSNDRTFSVRLTTWQQDAVRFSPLRQQVFVNEQRVPAEIETDAFDADCVHAIAEDKSGNVIGTGRLLFSAGRTARIGRMAVYSEWRNNGVGAALLRVLVDEAQRRGEKVIVLHAQIHAERFYANRGFVRANASTRCPSDSWAASLMSVWVPNASKRSTALPGSQIMLGPSAKVLKHWCWTTTWKSWSANPGRCRTPPRSPEPKRPACSPRSINSSGTQPANATVTAKAPLP